LVGSAARRLHRDGDAGDSGVTRGRGGADERQLAGLQQPDRLDLRRQRVLVQDRDGAIKTITMAVSGSGLAGAPGGYTTTITT